MRITVDANILFSGLIKSGMTRRIWFNPELELYAPKFLLIEFHKYKKTLESKFGGEGNDFECLAEKLLSQVSFVSDEDLLPYVPAAASLLKDPKDWLYLACAFREDTIIWSNDKGFKSQSRIRTLNTEGMKKEFGFL